LFVRHWHTAAPAVLDRTAALKVVEIGLRRGTVCRTDGGGVSIAFPKAVSTYRLEPTQWREVGDMVQDAGDVGGDIQIGAAPERRFTHATLPGRVVDVTAYPIKGDGSDPMPPEDAPIHLSWQAHMTICRDVTDPGGTEEWADVAYPNLPEEYTGTYATVEDAERAARRLISFFNPAHIGWDGRPDWA
jgi:hypothetical protein